MEWKIFLVFLYFFQVWPSHGKTYCKHLKDVSIHELNDGLWDPKFTSSCTAHGITLHIVDVRLSVRSPFSSLYNLQASSMYDMIKGLLGPLPNHIDISLKDRWVYVQNVGKRRVGRSIASKKRQEQRAAKRHKLNEGDFFKVLAKHEKKTVYLHPFDKVHDEYVYKKPGTPLDKRSSRKYEKRFKIAFRATVDRDLGYYKTLVDSHSKKAKELMNEGLLTEQFNRTFGYARSPELELDALHKQYDVTNCRFIECSQYSHCVGDDYGDNAQCITDCASSLMGCPEEKRCFQPHYQMPARCRKLWFNATSLRYRMVRPLTIQDGYMYFCLLMLAASIFILACCLRRRREHVAALDKAEKLALVMPKEKENQFEVFF